MTADDALAIAHQAAKGDDLYYSFHSDERGERDQRWANQADIRNAVLTADVAVPSKDAPNRWILCGGCDLDDCGIRVVVAIDEDETVTVTVVTVLT